MKRSRACIAITGSVFIFIYLPIFFLIANSFNEARFGGIWAGFTWKWYNKLFHDSAIWEAMRNSLIVGVSSTFASTILGTMAAFAMHRFKSSLQAVHYSFIYFPLIIPDILMGISLLLFFVALNIKLGLFTIFIAHTTFCLSYVAMVMLSKLQHFDFSMIEAAQDLGADRRAVVRRILVPLLAPGIIAAALLAFTLSIDDFVITFFVAGEGVTTLPLYIYSMMKFGASPAMNALCTLILVITFIFISLYQAFSKEEV